MPASMPGPENTQSTLQRVPRSHFVRRTPSIGAIANTSSAGEGERRDAAHAARCRSPRRAAIGSQSASGGELEEDNEVEQLVERRRLAVERPLQHRHDDGRRRRGRTSVKTPSRQRAHERRRREHARRSAPRRSSSRRRSGTGAPASNGRSSNAWYWTASRSDGTNAAASVPTKMRRRRRASQASAAVDGEGGRRRRGRRARQRQRQRRADALLHAGEHRAPIAPEDERQRR